MKIHIVIPVYNNYYLTNNILWSLYKKEKANIDTILVVNDCSSAAEVATGLQWWDSHGLLPLRTIINKENMGFLKSSNLGIETILDFKTTAPEDVVILLSNDVRIESKFIQNIKDLTKEDPKSLIGGILYAHDTGWNTFSDRTFPYLEGWLLAATAKTWTELGTFDTAFVPNDFEDVDLSTRALALGYNLVSLNNPGIIHMGGQSIKYGDKRLAITHLNKKKFADKWSSK